MMQDNQPLYKWIVDSVIAKSRPAFLQEGVDEALLDDLRARWEQKLLHSEVFDAESGEEDEPVPKVVKGEADSDAAGPSTAGGAAGEATPAAAAGLEAAVGQKRKASPTKEQVAKRLEVAHAAAGGGIPQADGPADDGAEEDAGAGAGAADAGAGPSAAAAAAPVIDDDDGNLDDLDEDDEDEEDGEGIQNLVLAQYDKVARTKNRWKCHMKNGIVHIRGREYVFAKCTGEFTF